MISTPSLQLKKDRSINFFVLANKYGDSQFDLGLGITLHFHHEAQERVLQYFSVLQSDTEMRTVCFSEFAFLFLGH